MTDTIFVQIPAYRDPELVPTLKDLTEQAQHKERVRVVVCWQHGDEFTTEDLLDHDFMIYDMYRISYTNPDEKGSKSVYDVIHTTLNDVQVEFIDVPYQETFGACWARNLIQTQYKDERYTLHLDSHHRFVKGWDVEMVDMLESLRDKSDKPVLTSYPGGYTPGEEDKKSNTPCEIIITEIRTDQASFVSVQPKGIKNYKELSEPLPARFYAAGFVFADGFFNKEVKYDPLYFFNGEEISMSLRAFTHGYDLYAPHKNLLWHEYVRKGKTRVWDDSTPKAHKKGETVIDWTTQNKKTLNLNRKLFGLEEGDGGSKPEYGVGNVRTYEEFEKYMGINFKEEKASIWTIEHKDPSKDPIAKLPYDEWKEQLIGMTEVNVRVDVKDIGRLTDDLKTITVYLKDKDNKTLAHKTLKPNEFEPMLKRGKIKTRIRKLLIGEAEKILIWPYSHSEKWLDSTEHPISNKG